MIATWSEIIWNIKNKLTSLNTSLTASNSPILGIYREEFLSMLDALLTKTCCEIAFDMF